MAQAAPLPMQVEELPDEEPPQKPTRATRGKPAPASGGGIPNGVVYGLAGYALLMTLLAIYGLFFRGVEKLDPGHPLSTIPDNFGEFPAPDRKKVSQLKFPVDGELPENLKAGLGGKIEVGQLEIEPVKVGTRRLNMVAKGKAEERTTTSRDDALVLILKVKNTSPDIAIFPMDPAFTRRSIGDDKPATRLVVGKQTFAGGANTWPFRSGVVREYEKDQENDAVPLKPGETREYVVCSPADRNVAAVVRNAKDTVQWRVQVRRGLIEFKGKDVPVTAIIGVEFKASDVKELE